MKLLTTIKPRGNGTVIVRDSAGNAHVFKPDDAGALVCEIEDQALVGRLLAGEMFEPADEADHQAAEALLRNAISKPGEFGEGDDDGDDFDGDPDEVPDGALPEEANTPPVARARPRRARRAR